MFNKGAVGSAECIHHLLSVSSIVRAAEQVIANSLKVAVISEVNDAVEALHFEDLCRACVRAALNHNLFAAAFVHHVRVLGECKAQEVQVIDEGRTPVSVGHEGVSVGRANDRLRCRQAAGLEHP